jgi:hypothetical protein
MSSAYPDIGQKYLLLLLTEDYRTVKSKPGIPAVTYRVLDYLTSADGPLNESLTLWSDQRPSKVVYRRLEIARTDTETLARLGVCWLPQVRLVRRGRVLFRSSVSRGDNGEFLAQDVGGRSFRRRTDPSPEGYITLLDALSAEVDKTTTRT